MATLVATVAISTRAPQSSEDSILDIFSQFNRRDSATADFYTRFYTAAWDWLVRSGTDWHVECAKPHLRGTGRFGTGRQERLRIAHNPKVAGSNPAPATNENTGQGRSPGAGSPRSRPDF